MIGFLVKTLCYTAILFAFLHTAIGYLLKWVEERPTHEDQGPCLQRLKNAGLEFLYCLLQMLSYPLAFIPRNPPTFLREGKGIPVLFIHGYLSHRLMWSWLIHHLRKQPDIGPLYTLNLWPPLSSIRNAAQSLEQKVYQIRNETGATQVILVGHSIGGLVASTLAESILEPKSIAKIITLGTPFEGTDLAALGIGNNAVDLLRDSAFLKELSERLASTTTPYYCIASRFDQVVIPWTSALHPNGLPEKQMLIVEDQGHFGLLFSKTVLEQLYQWLRS